MIEYKHDIFFLSPNRVLEVLNLSDIRRNLKLGGVEGGLWHDLSRVLTKTSQELRMLSTVTLNCQMILINSSSQLSEL